MKRCRNEAHIRHRWLGDAPQQPRRGPQCGASRFVDELALSASDPEDLLEESGWRARLAATGWPTEPLPEVVVAAAETRLTGRLDPRGVTATLILVLWANAVLTGTRDRLRDVASATLAHYLDRTMSFHPTTYDSFAKLCRAAVDWADGRTEPRLPTTDHPAPTSTVIDRRYHGLTVEGETAVLVVESDGSHRLLRTEDGRVSGRDARSGVGAGEAMPTR